VIACDRCLQRLAGFAKQFDCRHRTAARPTGSYDAGLIAGFSASFSALGLSLHRVLCGLRQLTFQM
jgi:hypothetical protein